MDEVPMPTQPPAQPAAQAPQQPVPAITPEQAAALIGGKPMICPICHYPVKPEYYFCPNCGAKLTRAAARRRARRPIIALRVQHHPAVDRISCDHEVAGDQISPRAGRADEADRPHRAHPAHRIERHRVLAYDRVDTELHSVIAE